MKKIVFAVRLIIIAILLASIPANVFAASYYKADWFIHWYCPSIGQDFEEYIFFVPKGSTCEDVFGFYFNVCKFKSGFLRISPNLRSLVSFQHDPFNNLEPEKVYDITILINVPPNMPTRWYNGTVQFISFSGPRVPKPLKISICVTEAGGIGIFRKHRGLLITITDEIGLKF